MKKLITLGLVIIASVSIVFAAPSPSQDPALNENNYQIAGDNAGGKRLIGLVTVEHVEADGIDDLIKQQNDKVAKGNRKVLDKIAELLGAPAKELEDAVVVGTGFKEIKVVDADGAKTHDGASFELNVPGITNQTEAVYMVHYSEARGFELVKADSFDTSKNTAKFTLQDTSPVMILIRYKEGTTGQYSPAKTGVDGMPANNIVRFGALAVLGLCAIAATAIVIRKRYE